MQETEMRNEKTKNIDKVSTIEMLKMINNENICVTEAVNNAIDDIAKVVDIVSKAFLNNKRLFYIGAGTSGRLGVLDASECPPTFGVTNDVVTGIIAGGDDALRNASEGAEDNFNDGIKDVKKYGIKKGDVIIGISASGNADYVLGALTYSNEIGAYTVSLCCNEKSKINEEAKHNIITKTGPEALTGSTRLKAGTAHKIVLNMISTGAMIKSGKVYENYMINVKPTNIKLRQRCISIISDIKNVDLKTAEEYLIKGKDSIKEAISLIEKDRG